MASTRAWGLPATPAAARRRQEQDQGWVSLAPHHRAQHQHNPAPGASQSHPPAPGNPYLGVQGAQQRVQLHVQAAAADVDGSFQDLAEALHSERPGLQSVVGQGEDGRRWGATSRASTRSPRAGSGGESGDPQPTAVGNVGHLPRGTVWEPPRSCPCPGAVAGDQGDAQPGSGTGPRQQLRAPQLLTLDM